MSTNTSPLRLTKLFLSTVYKKAERRPQTGECMEADWNKRPQPSLLSLLQELWMLQSAERDQQFLSRPSLDRNLVWTGL